MQYNFSFLKTVLLLLHNVQHIRRLGILFFRRKVLNTIVNNYVRETSI